MLRFLRCKPHNNESNMIFAEIKTWYKTGNSTLHSSAQGGKTFKAEWQKPLHYAKLLSWNIAAWYPISPFRAPSLEDFHLFATDPKGGNFVLFQTCALKSVQCEDNAEFKHCSFFQIVFGSPFVFPFNTPFPHKFIFCPIPAWEIAACGR